MLQDITELPITLLHNLSNLHRFFGKFMQKFTNSELINHKSCSIRQL